MPKAGLYCPARHWTQDLRAPRWIGSVNHLPTARDEYLTFTGTALPSIKFFPVCAEAKVRDWGVCAEEDLENLKKPTKSRRCDKTCYASVSKENGFITFADETIGLQFFIGPKSSVWSAHLRVRNSQRRIPVEGNAKGRGERQVNSFFRKWKPCFFVQWSVCTLRLNPIWQKMICGKSRCGMVFNSRFLLRK